MTENPHVTLLRDCYERWEDSLGTNSECWLGIVADDFHLRSISSGRDGVEFTATCRCRAEAAGYLRALARDWDMEFQRMHDFIAEGDRVVAIGRTAWVNKATGKRAETAKVDIWRFRDGMAVEFSEFYDSAGMVEAATPDLATVEPAE